jgi:hypothetical protein
MLRVVFEYVYLMSVAALTLNAQMQGVFDGAVFSGCNFSQVPKRPRQRLLPQLTRHLRRN